MESKKRAELLEVISEQNSTLQKYKKRLHDVVESYKNLAKEKEALQESVKFLTEGKHLGDAPESSQESDSEKDGVKKVDSSKEVNSANTFEALKTSLRVLTTDKTRIENELKTDRRRLLKENEDLQVQLKNKEIELSNEKAKFDTTVKELRKQIRDQQKEREKEQQDHAVMLKELQSLVADERCAKEKFEQQLESLKFALEKLPDKRCEYEKHISDLQGELSNMKDLLKAAEGEKKDLPSLLRQLQQEMCEMKERHQEAVEREYKRANEAEEKLKALATLSEERAASLEQRLCELSQMVGNYDKLRQQDQIAIQKLKERVAQLDQENSALANTVAGAEKIQSLDSIDENIDNQAIVDQITKLKKLLHLATQKSKRIPSLSGLLAEMQKDEDDFLNPHSACEKECERLRMELAQCKQKLQSAKAVYSLELESQSEVISLRNKVKSLKEELEKSQFQMKEIESKTLKEIQKLEASLSEVKSNRTQELSALKMDYQMKQMELEQQVQKQRERSITLLEDKETEITQLKTSLQIKEKQLKKSMESADDSPENSDKKQLTDLLSSSVSSSKKGKILLFYTQELSRKDVDISNLRKSRVQTETALRELQQTILMKEENYQDEIEILKSQIKRLESIQKGANMEYLKNVILRLIKCNDPNDQSHMINAIAAILHFTPVELQEIKLHRQSGIWSLQRSS